MRLRIYRWFLLLLVAQVLLCIFEQTYAQDHAAQSLDLANASVDASTSDSLSDEQDADEDTDEDGDDEGEESEQDEQLPDQQIVRSVNNILITGNKNVPEEAILNRLPYKRGEPYNKAKTSTAIRNLYSLGYFRHIEMLGENVGDDGMNLHIRLVEKKKLEGVKYHGKRNVTEKEVTKKIDFSKIPAIDEEELKKYAEIIRGIYIDKGYHFAQVTPSMEIDGDKATAVFTVEENKPSAVKQIFFEGNHNISSKKLRGILFTREDWVLSFMDSAGTYHPDAVEQDKFSIETFYQNHGYLTARVVDAQVEMDPKTKNFYITFTIEEGPQYTVNEIKVPGNEFVSEEELMRILPIRKGDLYSKTRVQKSIERLRNLWGERGYIYADVEPSIQPDEEKKTVNIAFYSELGNKVSLRRINIVGNKKSRDKIIRRQLILDEGDLLTTQKMDFSKDRVELLGFFDKRDGVNWKINRVSDNLCDLDLIVKEVRTGSATIQAGAGGSITDITDPTRVFTINMGFADTNFLGYGIQYDISMMLSRSEQSGHINILDPWLFDKPISGAASLYASRVDYQDLRSVSQQVSERRIGGSGGIGFFLARPRDAHVQFQAGIENISYGNNKDETPKAAHIATQAETEEFQNILNRRFQNGTLAWVSNIINQDMRNHPVHPSQGYQWSSTLKVGLSVGIPGKHEPTPQNREKFGFVKFDGDVSWYTPLIGENDLVLCLHGHVGVVEQFGDHTIPYRELYHIGGPATVRGFVFGQISPMWGPNSIGARRAFWENVELIFPINPDFTMKGAIFYDGGAGWHTPDASQILSSPGAGELRNNKFNYRHAVGVGVRLLQPVPLQIDWGFKLDRNKKLGEKVSEIIFTMNHNF